MGATDLSWSLGANWVEFKKGINDAKSFSEKALYDISHSAARSLILFSSPIDTRRVQAALNFTSLTARNLGQVFLSSYAIYKLTFGKLPNLFKPIGDKFGELGARVRATAWKMQKDVLSTMSPDSFKKYKDFFARHPLLDKMVHGTKNMMQKPKDETGGFGKAFAYMAGLVIGWAQKMGSAIFNIAVAISKVALLLAGTAGLLGVILAGVLAKMMETGKVLDDVSRASGIAGKEILTVQYMLVRMGASAEQANGLLVEMRDNLYEASTGFGEAARWAAFMGLNVGNLLRMKPSEAFEKIATAIKGLNASQMGYAAKALLGGSGGAAAAQVRSIKETLALYGKIIDAVDKNKSEMAGIVVAWHNIRAIGEGFFAIMSSKVAKDLRGVFESIAGWMSKSLDYAGKFGEQLDKAVRIVTNIFTMPADKSDKLDTPFHRVIHIMMVGFEIAVAKFGNLMVAAIRSIKPLLIWLFMSSIPYLVAGMRKAAEVAVKILAEPIEYGKYKTENRKKADDYAEQSERALKLKHAAHDKKDYFGEAFYGAEANKYGGISQDAKERSTGAGFGEEGIDKIASFEDVLIHTIDEWKLQSKNDKFGVAKLTEKLNGLVARFAGEVPASALPGKTGGGATLRSPTFLNVFDELRKIGGGLGNTGKLVQGNQMLDETKKIVNNTDRTAQYMKDFANKQDDDGGYRASPSNMPGIAGTTPYGGN